jgi:hypothetical protein
VCSQEDSQLQETALQAVALWTEWVTTAQHQQQKKKMKKKKEEEEEEEEERAENAALLATRDAALRCLLFEDSKFLLADLMGRDFCPKAEDLARVLVGPEA